MKILFKATMFASLHGGGHMQIYEAVDYPGVTRTALRGKDRIWMRIYAFEGQEVESLTEAVKLHTEAYPLA